MNPNVVEIEAQIDTLRHCLPDSKDLEEAKRLLCQAQNILQKHIEKTVAPADWMHVKTVAPTQSTYGLGFGGGAE